MKQDYFFFEKHLRSMQCAPTLSKVYLSTYHPPWHLHDLRFRVYSKLYGSECSRLNNRGKMNWPILLLLVWGTHYNFFVIIAWQATAYVNNMNALFNDIFACFSIYCYYIILVCILFFPFCFRSTSSRIEQWMTKRKWWFFVKKARQHLEKKHPVRKM